MSGVNISLLGGFQMEVGQQTISRLESRKVESLLAFLVFYQDRPHPREVLVGMFWPDMPEAKAKANLRRALYVIRKALGDHKDDILTASNQVQFDPDSNVWLDTQAFEQFLDQAKSASELEKLNHLEQAVGLYHGPLMDGYYDDWLMKEQQRLSDAYLNVLEQLGEGQADLGQYEKAIESCQQLIAVQPAHEPAYRQKMRCHYHLGQQQQALQTYHACKLTLQQWNMQVSPETQGLYEQILKHDVPPAARVTPNNLPQQLTPFVGRDDELGQIEKLLRDDECRVLSLIGPGGIGKTRLGLEAASRLLNQFEDGVYFIPLVDVDSEDLMMTTMADVFSLNFLPGVPPKQQLADYLSGKKLLLLLDNFEHLIEGAFILGELLAQSAQMKALATSRENLKLQGEWVLDIEGLAVPASDEASIEDYSAVSLFLNSARRVHSGFSLSDDERPHLIQICQLVQGIPLALELAATWVRALSCEEIASEIQKNLDFLSTSSKELPQRHQSLQAVFEYSWTLLSKEERAVLKRLSVFQGGFRKEAAEAVADASVSVLLGLMYKSLLKRNSTGLYELLDVVRQYALAKLEETSKESSSTKARQSQYYAEFVQQRTDDLKGGRQIETLSAFTHEIANIRAGWEWAIHQKNEADVSKYLDGLFLFFEMKGWFEEGKAAFESVVEQGMNKAPLLLSKAMSRQAMFCERLNQLDDAKSILETSLQYLETSNQAKELAFALNALGTVEDILGNYDEAERIFERSLKLYQDGSDHWGLARVLINYGILHWEKGNYDQAKAFYQQSLELCEKLEDQWGVARAYNNLGGVGYARREYEDAKGWYQKSLEAYEVIGNWWAKSNVLNNLGAVANGLKDYESAKHFHEQNIDWCQQMGDQEGAAYALKNLGDVESQLGLYETAERHLREALTYAHQSEVPSFCVECVLGFAMLWIKQGNTEAASSLLQVVVHHPATFQDVKDRANQLLEGNQLSLPKPEKNLDPEQILADIVQSILNQKD